jgi:hypothetical protein
LPPDRRRFPPRRVPRHSGQRLARRRVVRHSVVPKASWSPAPGRCLSRTSQRLCRPLASTARWTHGLPGRPAARVGGRDLLAHRRPRLVLERLRCRQAQGSSVPRVPGHGRKLPVPPRLGCPAERPHPPGPIEPLLHPHRPHAHGSVHAVAKRSLPRLPTSRAGPPGPRRNGAASRHGRATARLGTRWPDRGRWGSCPCATGRRLVGRSPRWGRVEIRLGPAWVRYRGTATPETDPPSTFHRPVLVPGRHRARFSRLRVTLPRCRPFPWWPSAAMPTAPISPARVRLLLPGPLPCVAGIPARQGACSGNRHCAPGPSVLHRVAD